MLKCRKLVTSATRLTTFGGKQISTGMAHLQGVPEPSDRNDLPQPTYVLVPPGSSMKDPLTYSVSDPVYQYDPTQKVGHARRHFPRRGITLSTKVSNISRPTPASPTSRRVTVVSGPEPKRQNRPNNNDPYVYLPPGCSIRDPSYISMSDPVYFYDKSAK